MSRSPTGEQGPFRAAPSSEDSEDRGMTRFLVVPQWQGSPSSRAMQLIDGAHAIAGDLPRAKTTIVEVPLEAGESLGTGVRRLSSLVQVARLQLEAAASLRADAEGNDEAPERVVTIGGDAGVATTAALDAVGAARGELDAEAVVVWFGAHAALLDPTTSTTGAYEGMAAGALVGTDAPVAADPPLLAPDRLVLVGVRDASETELQVARERGIRIIPAEDVTANPSVVAETVAALASSAVFVHVALDVLDPSAIHGTTSPTPFGLDVATLTTALRALTAQGGDGVRVAGAAVTGFAPASAGAAVEDLGTILRVIGALA